MPHRVGVLRINNCIWGFPLSNNLPIYKYNPTANTYSSSNYGAPSTYTVYATAYGGDGCIYGVGPTKVMKFDPSDQTVVYTDVGVTPSADIFNASLATDTGELYCGQSTLGQNTFNYLYAQ